MKKYFARIKSKYNHEIFDRSIDFGTKEEATEAGKEMLRPPKGWSSDFYSEIVCIEEHVL